MAQNNIVTNLLHNKYDASTDALNNITVFQKRGGTTNHGTNYEIYVTALVALRLALDDDVERLQIASNHPDFGAFDDIIVQVKRFGHKSKTYAIQLKHKTKQKLIGGSFFTSDDFCILKYKETFLDVKSKLEPDDLENTTFCLFTNFDVEQKSLERIPFKLKKHLERKENKIIFSESLHFSMRRHLVLNPKDFLYTKGNICELKIQAKNDSEKQSFDQYQEFFRKFNFYGGQLNSEEVKLQITDEFTKRFGIQAQEVGEKFILFVDDWFFRKSEISWLSKRHIKLKILELLLTPFLIEPVMTGVYLKHPNLWNLIVDFGNVILVDENLEDMNCLSKIYDAIEYKMKEILNVSVNFRNWLQFIPKDQEAAIKEKRLGSILNTVNEYGRINTKRLLIASWKMGFVPLVLKVNDCNKNYLTTILNANLDFNGNYILVGKSFGNLKLDKTLKIVTNMSVNKSLSKIRKMSNGMENLIQRYPKYFSTWVKKVNPILKKIKTLDKFATTKGLHTSLGNVNEILRILEKIQRALKWLYKRTHIAKRRKIKKTFKNLSNSQSVLISLKNNALKFFYFNVADDLARTLQTEISKAAILNLQGRLQLRLFDIVENNTKGLNKILQKLTPSFLLRVMETREATNTLRTYNVGITLKQNSADYIMRNFKWRKLIISEKDLLKKFENYVNVVSGDPGMGKTTTLKSLAFHCNPKYWVLLVNLNKIQEDFFDTSKSKLLEDPIQHLFEKLETNATSVAMALFRYFRKNKNVLVMLDSFDEVSPRYNDMVINIIKKAKEEKLRVCIATRPFARSFIEQAFKSRTIFMLGFEEQDFIKYLTLHNVRQKDKDFILSNIDKKFYRIPLHAYMLTTVKNINDQFEITDVYEKFIAHKFDTFCKKHDLLQSKNNIDVLLKPSKKQLIKNHEVMALAVIFGLGFFQVTIAMYHNELIIDFKRAIEVTENCKNPLGLVTGISNGIPTFVHKSYAEYMAAKWLSRNLTRAIVDDYVPPIQFNPHGLVEKDAGSEMFYLVRCYVKLFEAGNKVVRLMFDKIAAEGKPLHLAVLNSNLAKVRELCSKKIEDNGNFDKFGRTPLHLAVSVFEPHTSFLTNCGDVNRIKCKILSILVEYVYNNPEINFYTTDLFGWTCFNYALLVGMEELPHIAASNGEIKILWLFLNHLSEPEVKAIINKKDSKSMTLLSIATVKGYIGIIEYLVTKGADIEERDSAENTPLQIASKYGHLEVVKYLIDAGANIKTFNQFGSTPLHSAAYYGHLEVVKYLVKIGLDVDVVDNSVKTKKTPLHMAAARGHLQIVEYLVDQGADITAEDVNASTPSYLATERGHKTVAMYLIEQEAKSYENFINQDPVDHKYSEVESDDDPDEANHYISLMAVLYVLKLTVSENVEDFIIGFNFEEYGEFGDIIIGVNFSDKETSEVLAIGFTRTEHELDIHAMNEHYNLLKLALQDSSDVEFNDLSLYLHVNSELKKDEQGNCKYLPSVDEDFMGRKYYKLNANSEYEKVISKFHLYFDSFDCEEAKKSLKSILKTEFGRSDENVLKKMTSFIKSKDGYFRSKYDMKSKLLQCFLSPFIVEPEIHTSLGINELVWEELVNTSDVTLVNNCPYEVIRKILYSMQQHVKGNCNLNLNLKLWLQYKKVHPVMRHLPGIKDLMIMLWKRQVLPLFIKIPAEEINFVSTILTTLFLVDHKFIIMSDGLHSLKLRKDLIIFDSLAIAADGIKTNILENIGVSLQGRSATNLLKLTDKLDRNLISSTFVIRMNKVNAICERLKPKPDFYISRRFFKLLLCVEVLWKTEGNIFILDREVEPNMYECRQNGLNVINLEEISDEVADLILNTEDLNVILIVGQDKTNLLYNKLLEYEKLKFLKIHCLKVAGIYLEWLKSSEGVRILTDFLVETETVGEGDLLEYFKNSLNVISGIAGMGKSTALQSLIWTCSSEKFVLSVNLAELLVDFKQKCTELVSDPLTYLYRKQYGQTLTALEEEVFKFCREQKKLVVFMDEFDKLLNLFAAPLMNIIEKLLQEDGISIWIATRPLGAIPLQEKFHIIPINMQELDDREKEKYLDKLLHMTVKEEQGDLYTKIKSSFYRIPLHLKILAELLDTKKITVNELQNRVEFFQHFVHYKIHKIYKSNNRDEYNLQAFEKRCTHLFQILALISVYGKNFIVDNNISHEEFIEEAMNNVLKCAKDAGFINTIKNNTLVFTDEAYRDYFVVTWVYQNIEYSMCRTMYKLLFQSKFYSARVMFDKFAARGCSLHFAVLNNDVAEVARLCTVTTKLYMDRMGRTPLHLAASHFKLLPLKYPGHSISCEILNHVVCLMMKFKNDFSIQDNLLQWDWLEYAKASGNSELFHIAVYYGHFNIVKVYLENVKGHFYINKPSRDEQTPIELALKNHHEDIVVILLQNGVSERSHTIAVIKLYLEAFYYKPV